ncbi:hypothetical protein Glove_21g105 [Diversispora epigaea]|uniref:TFIIB-type domain-containing protein n=1 Tax=Diversispora epigaea TaxID=1348612 RepID=A0A397JRS2_9GLOM|nr:hypothetical protein Glove_21g105 [Diversispora epigaea]
MFPSSSSNIPFQTSTTKTNNNRIVKPNLKLIEEFASGNMVCGECGLVLDDRIIEYIK